MQITFITFVLSVLCLSYRTISNKIFVHGFIFIFPVIMENQFHSNETKHFVLHVVLTESQWCYSCM